MKGIIIALIIGAGGYYYLANYHYAPNQNEYLNKYLADENKSSDDSTLFVEDPNDYDNQLIQNKKEVEESTKASDNSKPERELMVNQGNYEGSSETYQCDGRTKCMQMNTCLEARFFLANCPGVDMDPDEDGVPCERNLCGGTVF